MKNITFLCFCLVLSGCSFLHAHSDNLPKKLESWTKENKFKHALSTINYVNTKHKDYKKIQKLKLAIIEKAKKYEEEQIEFAKNLAEKGQWVKAFIALDKAIDTLPSPGKILKVRKDLLDQREVILLTYDNLLLSTHAQKLADDLAIYENLKVILTEEEARRFHVDEYNKSRIEACLKLAKRSQEQYNSGQFILASATIDTALSLKPEGEILNQLQLIQKQIDSDRERKKQIQISRIKALINKLQQGYSHEILVQANIMLDWLIENKAKGSSEDDKLIKTLETHLSKGINQYIEAARNLYSKGKIQQALDIWKELYLFNPQHPKLLSHINRAEKVLAKLKKLQKSSKEPLKK